MRSRKAQITLFIIIGIVILFGTFFFLYIRTQILKQPVQLAVSKAPLEAQPVKTFVDSCIQDSLVKGSYLAADQGGRILPDTSTLIAQNNFISYAFDSGVLKAPTTSDVGKQIADYMALNIPFCTNNFTSFASQGYFIQEGQLDAQVSVGLSSITALVTYPVTITFANKTSKLSSFQASAPIRMGSVLNAVGSIVKKESNSNNSIDLGDLGTIGYNITVVPYDSDTIIYTIYDPASNVDGAPFIFNFASRNPASDSPPELEFIPDFVLGVNEPFSYAVKAVDPDGDAVTFRDNTDLFEINPNTGQISFTPITAGDYQVLITATDSKANTASQFVRFTVR